MSSTRSKDGTLIAFDRSGDGISVVLVHPAYGHRGFDPPMAELAGLLSRDFAVFTYDRRGRGESSDTQPYAVEREIEDIAALIGEAGGSAFVYGMSSGAVLALEAANRGLPITKLALYEPPFIVDGSRPPYPADYVQHLAKLISSGRRDEAVAYAMAHAGVPDFVVDQMKTQQAWQAFESVAHTLVYDGKIMGDTQRGHALPAERTRSVAIPVMTIVGSKAPDWARHSAKALVAALPKGLLQTVEAEFHMVVPSVVAPMLVEFFGASASSSKGRTKP